MNLVEMKASLDEKQQQAEKLQQELQQARVELDAANKRLTSAEEQLSLYVGVVPKIENASTLKEYVVQVLENSNEPLTAKEIAELAKEAGYKTTSKDSFAKMVYMVCVQNAEIRRATKTKTRPTKFAIKS